MTAVTIAHLSDIHFGRDVDLDQIEALEALVPSLRPDAVVLAGDLTQRARHGELQRALAFAQTLRRTAPTLAIPGNHDVQWWASPFGLFGRAPRYTKWRRYFGANLSPTLEIPGAVIASALTGFGVSFPSMTWNLNDTAVKGHLPASETERVSGYFRGAPPGAARILVVHHNVLRGDISRRMGLARWRTAQARIRAAGADLVLCGHDHQEGAGQLDGVVAVSTAGTHTSRSRGGRPSAFNLVSVDAQSIAIRHFRWEADTRRFTASDLARFARPRPG